MPRRRGLAHSLADTLVRSGERTMTVDHAVDEFRAELMAPGRILLIDDEQAIRAAIGRALIAEGHAVDFADTGSDGGRSRTTAERDTSVVRYLRR
jgi:PleD family two-component response regulator